jgi:starch synthase (maltosyl-transferring)
VALGTSFSDFDEEIGLPMAAPRTHHSGDVSNHDDEQNLTQMGVAMPFPTHLSRPTIARVRPQVDCGRRPAKAAVGDLVRIEADAFVDGHDVVCCLLRYRHDADAKWTTVPMESLGNDRWRGALPVNELGRYRFAVRAAVDRFATWRRDLASRDAVGQGASQDFLLGAQLLQEAARRAKSDDRRRLSLIADQLRLPVVNLEHEITAGVVNSSGASLRDVVFSDWLALLMIDNDDPSHFVTSEVFFITSDPTRARFSSWYELFPRSAAADPLRHGTFADVEARLDYVQAMGFDVLYLPPIHPIGVTGRKGRNGVTSAGKTDPGSPWAIGAREGGHTAVHPELGTLEDFRHLVRAAAARGIDVALDLAFQASPDHPWVQEHPDWFHHLPNGTIRYAENPPKRYEDIYPLDFRGLEWRALWHELLEVVLFWVAQGVTVFRVDNPHTKPFAFWEWLLASVKAEHPETIFLSEAFTRPRVMEHLAKIGFSQSYTYFTWRSAKWEIEAYLNELTRSDVADYLRPNFWPNTPDILSEELQVGGRAAFVSRFVLAATLCSNYGIYGPVFELQEHVPRERGSEEYLNAEKYELRSWDIKDPRNLSDFIALVNQIRREHPALQFNDALIFHSVDNEKIIAYSKTRTTRPDSDVIVVVVSLDHESPQSGWVALDTVALGIEQATPYVMHDLLTDARYVWRGARNFVKLDPTGVPCHLFSLEQSPDAIAVR